MITNVKHVIETRNMFRKGDRVLVGVSGGPDSICLLHLLYTLKEELNLTIMAAHINHCLRGKEADKDEEYVKEFCSKIGVECFSVRINIVKLSQEKGISCETAGREARYDFFNKLRHQYRCDKIALAHNANDQSETILMRIMRGTGLDGLTGIRPVRDGIYVRPLITTRRSEIEKYCEENALNPRIDKSNLENIYSRNKVRLELIPYIENNFNSDIISVLNRMAETISLDNEYLECITLEKFKNYCEVAEDKVIIKKTAFQEHYTILARLIRMAVHSLVGSLQNFERTHIYDVIKLSGLSTGKRVTLPGGVTGLNSYGDIHLLIQKTETMDCRLSEELSLGLNEVNYLNNMKLRVSLRVISSYEAVSFSKDSYVRYFDYDKLHKNIILRYRRDGDKFSPLGMKGQKKLKDFFIDEKVPKEDRDKVPLICSGDEIAWVIGYRVSEKFKVDETTKTILEIKVEREVQE